MPDAASPGDPQAVRDAVSELCYEVALACGADFSFCGTAVSLGAARQALVQRFRYAATAREVTRFRQSDSAWFETIRADLDAGRPLLYSTLIHTMVCDGWQEVDGVPLIHLNCGWGGSDDGWFALDSVQTSYNPDTEKIVCGLTPRHRHAGGPGRLHGEARRTAGATRLARARVRGDHRAACLAGNPRRRPAVPDRRAASLRDRDGMDRRRTAGVRGLLLARSAGRRAPSWFGPARAEPASFVAGLVLAGIRPNPCNPDFTATVSLARAQHLFAAVFDLRGRRIATLADGAASSGEHELRWNGRTADGRDAPSGTYLLRLAGEDAVVVRRVALVR